MFHLPSRHRSPPSDSNQQVSPSGDTLVPFYAPFNFNPFNIFQTPFERFNMYGAGRYEVSDAVEVYSRGIFSKNTVSTIIAPSSSSSTRFGFGGGGAGDGGGLLDEARPRGLIGRQHDEVGHCSHLDQCVLLLLGWWVWWRLW
mgnify:CR=1 FL=1